ncbi:NFX1-type zinc finger-containing protein 1 [Ascodesmis nigricans]|uniref:NFX1-type zinc finger-containing protein 1 n=1 Tax=Ascodesmis nigricans TaxID=341454 RepID=A0A4S2MKY0_9PEZI|nr:NFX1-type zinc finger-containing protein 1 [Ascodesmis nigricans]
MDRQRRLNKVLNDVLCGTKPLNNGTTANLFLEAVVSQPDPAACANRLITSRCGLPALQASLRFSNSVAFFNGSAAALLKYISNPSVKQIFDGDYLRQLLSCITEPPIFWNAYQQAFEKDLLDASGQCAFGWLLFELISMPSDDSEKFRDIAQEKSIQERLLGSSDQQTRTYGQKIKLVASSLSTGTTSNEDFAPGGRHDNDFVDFRQISILPTADELTSKEPPFLLTAEALDDPETADERLGIYISNQFRLLREDMLGEMRDELLIAQGYKKGKHRGVKLEDLKFDGALDFGQQNSGGITEPRSRQPLGIRLICKSGFGRLQSTKSQDDRRNQLKNDRKFLQHQAFACLLIDKEVVAFPTIYRNLDLLAENPPKIVLQIGDSPVNNAKLLTKLKESKKYKIDLIQIDTAVFAYEPVLRRLQDIKNLELHEEILHYAPGTTIDPPPNPPQNIIEMINDQPDADLQDILNFQLKTPLILDDSQRKSLLMSLTQRVSLIQGPPGTGKSFIGALLTKILFDNTKKTILIATYTNHALDTFLEDLLQYGIPHDHILRIGGRAADTVERLSLYNQPRTRLDSKAWKRVAVLKTEAENLEREIRAEMKDFMNTTIGNEQLMNYLQFEEPLYYEAFEMPTSDDGMKVVGKKGKGVNKYYLIDQWRQNQLPAKSFGDKITGRFEHIWKMPKENRSAVMQKWREALLSEAVEKIVGLMKEYNECQMAATKADNERFNTVIKSKRIIACTTTGAAKYVDQLQAASPEILLVEEAGEILESHILTALGKDTEQLILIGDHKQLRPKINNYSLSVEKGEGYDLNVSMFERLVRKGFPHQALSQQHRMRPEISALVRALTYPDLRDADKTKNRPNIRGLQDNLIFIAHNFQEDENRQMRSLSDEMTNKSSKQNLYEVEMILRCVKYLSQQGYGTGDMVILTPYLGQLGLLHQRLKAMAETDPVLNDLDTHDLVAAGLMPAASAKLAKRSIRLATIDNYQGEESDIVLVSLTRGNPSHDIGFMFSPERLNVLLSRARNGLIMIGNAETFAQSRKGGELWTKLFGLLKEGGHIYEGLPIVCHRHPDKKSILSYPAQFDEQVPDGGCIQPCGSMLSCGVHQCPYRCHQLSDHSKMQCEVIMTDICPNNHPRTWKCFQLIPIACPICEKQAKMREEKKKKDFERQQRIEQANKAHIEEMNKLQAELEEAREDLQEKQAATQRTAAILQRMKDLEDMKKARDQQNSNRPQQRPTTPPRAKASKKASKPQGASPSSPSDHDNDVTSSPAPLGPTGPSGPSGPPSPPSEPSENNVSDEGDYHTPNEQESSDDDDDNDPDEPDTLPPDFQGPASSPSSDEWNRQKTYEAAFNEHIDKLMDLIGLEEVKDQVLKIKAKIDVAMRQGIDLSDERFNVAMLGNPGTGKTTVARLYAKILGSMNIIPSDTFIETTGASLADDGVKGAKDMVEKLKGTGGVMFVDESYQLSDGKNMGGHSVLEYLLAEMENNVGKIVFIFAGYNREMESFFEANPGIMSRIPYTLHFKDYENYDLLEIAKRRFKMKFSGRMRLERGLDGLYMRIFIRRIGAMRGRPGFGNARAVENAFAKLTERQAARITKERKNGKLPDDMWLCKADLIGHDPSKQILMSDAWVKLQKLIGLQSVKDSIRAMIDRIQENYKRELAEKPPIKISLNRVFLGSPGTGKTTVAKLYGEILVDLGLLSNGEVIIKNPADFTGAHLGESEKNTKKILDATKGKVLVIDEFYGLYSGGGASSIGNHSDPYKTAVIDTIVAEVQSVPGEDRCVLLLGYEDQMRDMFDNVNPGLARRFALSDSFMFDDFTREELGRILDLKLKSDGLAVTPQARDVALEVLERAKMRPNFGNGGEVENILSRAKVNYQTRRSKLPPKKRALDIVFAPEDFDPEHDRGKNASANIQKLFADVIGCENVIQKLEGFQRIYANMKALGRDPIGKIPTNFVFKGPPGTGKTTTARKIGQVYYDMGMLGSTEVVDCTASDMIGQYVGQTAPKTRKQLEKALGKILFVDEAYRLAENKFATEAINELVDALTKPKFFGKLIVILAGYDADMNHLMSINPGLSSRFPEEIIFHNMSADHCIALLCLQLSKEDITFVEAKDPASPVYRQLHQQFSNFMTLQSWGNGRDVETIAKALVQLTFQSATPTMAIDPSVAFSCIDRIYQERLNRVTNVGSSINSMRTTPADLVAPIQPPPPQLAPPKLATKTATQTATQTAPPPVMTPEGSSDEDENSSDETTIIARDAGVSDQIWAKLQLAKQQQEAEQAKRDRRLKEAEEKLQKVKAAEEKIRLARLQAQQLEEEDRKRLLEAARIKAEEIRRIRELLEEKRRREEERKKEEAKKQQKLRNMGVCCMGYNWIKQPGGYRCAGGSHWVSDAQLQ